MLRAVGWFFKRVGWTFLWLVENVYVAIMRMLAPGRPIGPGWDRGQGGPALDDLREAARMDEQRHALRLSDIWGRSPQRVEHEIAKQKGHPQP
jgi:hypothetical protein